MAKSRILEVLIIIAISFCLLFTISFMASCKETAPAEEVLEIEIAEETTSVETTAVSEEMSAEEVSSTHEELLSACRRGNLEEVEKLIEKGVDVNAKDDIGWTAMMWAAVNGHTEIIELLIDNGAGFEVIDNNGLTALMWTAACGYTEAVELLIDRCRY